MSIRETTIEHVVTERARMVCCDCGCGQEERWRGRSWVRVYQVQGPILHFWDMDHAARWFAANHPQVAEAPGAAIPLAASERADAICGGDGIIICHCGGDTCVCGLDGERCPGCARCETSGEEDGGLTADLEASTERGAQQDEI